MTISTRQISKAENDDHFKLENCICLKSGKCPLPLRTQKTQMCYKWTHEDVRGKAQKIKAQKHSLKTGQTLSIHPL